MHNEKKKNKKIIDLALEVKKSTKNRKRKKRLLLFFSIRTLNRNLRCFANSQTGKQTKNPDKENF